MILLPLELRQVLIEAHKTPNTPADPNAKRKAIDTAIDYLKMQYPQYFKKEI